MTANNTVLVSNLITGKKTQDSDVRTPKPLSNDMISCRRLSVEDISVVKVIGQGAYATVCLVKHRDTGSYFALKAMSKEDILRRKQVRHVFNERNILYGTSHPNITKLFSTFVDQKYIYLVMEYVPGGDLFSLMQRAGRLSEFATKFYAANVILSLQYLHSKGVVYRDLKPENILLTSSGYLKLCDFGFAKMCDERNYTACGTFQYMAPEIIKNVGYGKDVDWWSLGTVIFEMLTGTQPFSEKGTESIPSVYRKLLHGEVVYPPYLSANAVDLIKKLLVSSPELRLGSQNDALDIMAHPFFQSIDFEKIFQQTESCPTFQNDWIERAGNVKSTVELDEQF